MKALLANDYFIAACRLLLGFLFITASIEKIADPNAFATSIGYYRLVGPTVALAVATVLPWIELLTGIFLIFGIVLRGSSLLVLVMLVVFTAGVVSGIVRGLDISCGCFSRDPSVGQIGWMKLLENTGMIIAAVAVLFSRTRRFSLNIAPQPSGAPEHDT